MVSVDGSYRWYFGAVPVFLLLLVAMSIDLHYDFSTAYRSRSLKRTSPAVPAVHQRTFGPFIVHSDHSVTLTVHEPDR